MLMKNRARPFRRALLGPTGQGPAAFVGRAAAAQPRNRVRNKPKFVRRFNIILVDSIVKPHRRNMNY
jgi:hypothetical protein